MPKRVLMITRPYYPSNASGVHRSAANAKYLPSFGWTPIVVCKDFSSANSGVTYDPDLALLQDPCEVIRVADTENHAIQTLDNALWSLIGGGLYDHRASYVLFRRMRHAAERIINSHKIDALWATSFPSFDHQIADYLSRKYAIPWAADFRDLPDQSYDNRHARYAARQEIKVCASAKALIATTEEMAAKLRARHTVPIYTVFNGFDPEEYESHTTAEQFGKEFTINHFGILYDYRNPRPLFAAIDLLHQRNAIDLADIRINFYGADSAMVDDFARPYCCASCVQTLPRLPYPQMIECQKASQILLMVASPQQGGAIPAKLYGYLASSRPILNVPGDGAGTDRIVEQTQAGMTSSKPEEIALWIEDAYHTWKMDRTVSFCGNEAEIQKYSRKRQASQVADILDKIAQK